MVMKKKNTLAKKIVARYAKLRARILRQKRQKVAAEQVEAPTEHAIERADGVDNLRDGGDGNSARTNVLREDQRGQQDSGPVVAADPDRPLEMNANHEPPQTIPPFGRNIRLPRSPFLRFSVLLPLLASVLPLGDMRRINFFYQHFTAGNITRQTLVDRIRLYAGDHLLRRIIETFNPLMQQRFAEYQRRRGGR